MKDAPWLKHDGNARNDERVLELRAEFGWEGYGLFWALVESMREATEYRLKLARMGGLSAGYGVPIATLMPIVNKAIEVGLFESDSEYFWSARLDRDMEIKDDRQARISEAGKRGAAKRWGNRLSDRVPIEVPNGVKMQEEKRIEEKREEPPLPPEGEDAETPEAKARRERDEAIAAEIERKRLKAEERARKRAEDAFDLDSLPIPPQLANDDFRLWWGKWGANRMKGKKPADGWREYFTDQLAYLLTLPHADAMDHVENSGRNRYTGLYPSRKPIQHNNGNAKPSNPGGLDTQKVRQ
jgi:hypothetical protein